MSIEFSCACGQVIAVPEQMGGKKGKCPRCGSILDVPFAGAAVAAPFAASAAAVAPGAPPAASPADEKPCPVCGERIKALAIKCRFCGEFLAGARPMSPAQRNEPAFGGVPREVTDAANLAMVLGIIGLTVCGLCAPFAAWKGSEARALARQHSFEPPSAATAGMIMGLIGSTMLVACVLAVVVWIALSMP